MVLFVSCGCRCYMSLPHGVVVVCGMQLWHFHALRICLWTWGCILSILIQAFVFEGDLCKMLACGEMTNI